MNLILIFNVLLFTLVDGGWSEWREFSQCSASNCGNGTRMWKRYCNNPDPKNGGQFCSGLDLKFEKCQDICQGKISLSVKLL